MHTAVHLDGGAVEVGGLADLLLAWAPYLDVRLADRGVELVQMDVKFNRLSPKIDLTINQVGPGRPRVVAGCRCPNWRGRLGPHHYVVISAHGVISKLLLDARYTIDDAAK